MKLPIIIMLTFFCSSCGVVNSAGIENAQKVCINNGGIDYISGVDPWASSRYEVTCKNGVTYQNMSHFK